MEPITRCFYEKLAEKLEVGEAIVSKWSENMPLHPLPIQLMSENSVILSIIYPPNENFENNK